MIDLNSIHKNAKVMVDGAPCNVVDFEHVKPGKGTAFTRCRLRNLITGQQLERTFKAGERFEEPNLEHKTMQYLYAEAEMLYFMDMTNYEQVIVNKSLVGEQASFLQENMECGVLFYNDKPINVELPTFVVMQIKYTEPGFKGDTATGASKPATLEGGHVITIPLHLKEADWVKVDTRNGEYVEKVNK